MELSLKYESTTIHAGIRRYGRYTPIKVYRSVAVIVMRAVVPKATSANDGTTVVAT
jgi:hypothetical protein